MKKILFLSFIYLLHADFTHALEKEVVITLHSSQAGATDQHYFLHETKNQLYCRTDNVPEHAIKLRKAKNLLGIRHAFDLPQLPTEQDCKNHLVFDRKSICYPAPSAPLLDDLLRWCSNI